MNGDVNAVAPPVLAALVVVLAVMVVWDRWPHVRWWVRRGLERRRLRREAWLLDRRPDR